MPLPIESYIDAAPDNAWVREFIAEWQIDRKTGGGDHVLAEKLKHYAQQSPDSALFVALVTQAIDDAERVAIAEELEWLMEKHGAAYWETINTLCQRVPQFRVVMACVWGASLSNDLKRKVEMWRN